MATTMTVPPDTAGTAPDETPQPGGPAAQPTYAESPGAVLDALGSSRDRGLGEGQVAALRDRYGPNELAEEAPDPWWKVLLAQFYETMVLLLLAAALISAFLKGPADALAILAIVIINALLGFFQQRRAERALTALRRLSAPAARVIRDGHLRALPARDLVPGDLVELEAGDQVPADVRLLSGFGVQVQESALTGESVPVAKDPPAVLAADTALGDRRNMAYLGTVVTAGKARAVVTATGMATELGRIAGLLQAHVPGSTPLQQRLNHLGKVLAVVILVLVAVFAGLQLLRGGELTEVFSLAVSLAVAALPEGLPAVVTIALALGLQRMVRRQALVRKLASVETLGSVTVICSDKTGTLTRNEMTVREVFCGGRGYAVTGSGFTPEGVFQPRGGEAAGGDPAADGDLRAALTVAARCNHARLVRAGEGGWQAAGDPTEVSLLVAARKAGVDGAAGGEVVHEAPFDSDRKMMSVAVRRPEGGEVLYCKGAPEVVLARCTAVRCGGQVVPLTEADRAAVTAEAAAQAERALRVLALAYRDIPAHGPGGGGDPYREGDLVLAGLAGLMDPPRAEAAEAIRVCRGAGIRPVMITGDHPATALAVARELGLAGPGDHAVSGRELDAMSDEDLAREVEHIPVYARVSAEHKLRVIRAWQARGQVVAMTGDGVNDAPALQKADIGVAMGITGTDVTRGASAMVLLDDNFATIVNAVEEGRGIFANIQRFVHYLLAGNIAKLSVMFAAALAGWPAPLLAIQILWLNLVTDGLPALGLGVEPPAKGMMRRPPRAPGSALLPTRRWVAILTQGALGAVAAGAGFLAVYGDGSGDLEHARAVAFCVLGFAQLAFALACRSQTRTAFELGFFSNPWLLVAVAVSGLLQLSAVLLPFMHPVFGIEAIPEPWEWGLIVALSLLPATVLELLKLVRRGLAARAAAAPGERDA